MISPLTPIATPVTKSEAAHAAIKEAILSRAIAPGQRLVIGKVARQLGTSLGPVREAVRRLESEGLVTITPHIGPVVTRATPEDLVANYRILAVLAGLAARLATPNLTPDDYEAVEQFIEAIDRDVREGRAGDADDHNLALHDRINRACGVERLRHMIMDLWTFSIRRHQLFFGLVPGRAQTANQEHREILAALRTRDPAVAERTMRKHTWHSADVFARYFRLEQAGPDGPKMHRDEGER